MNDNMLRVARALVAHPHRPEKHYIVCSKGIRVGASPCLGASIGEALLHEWRPESIREGEARKNLGTPEPETTP